MILLSTFIDNFKIKALSNRTNIILLQNSKEETTNVFQNSSTQRPSPDQSFTEHTVVSRSSEIRLNFLVKEALKVPF